MSKGLQELCQAIYGDKKVKEEKINMRELLAVLEEVNKTSISK